MPNTISEQTRATARAVKERPIIFSGPMVRAILAGKKTQTRRLVKPQPGAVPDGAYMDSYNHSTDWCFWLPDGRLANSVGPTENECMWRCHYGQPGSRLWVRENAYIAPPNFGDDPFTNCRDDESRPRLVSWAASMDGDSVRCATDYGVKLTPSIHMPRWASRITLEVTAVRVERLQAISDDDICRELGAPLQWQGEGPAPYVRNLPQSFEFLWDRINGKRAPWSSNPWVWAIAFKQVKP